MKLLVDSQAMIWYVDQDQLLSSTAHAAITDPNNELFISAATIWEIAIKVGIGKLSLSLPFRKWMEKSNRRSRTTHLADHGRVCRKPHKLAPPPRRSI